MLQISLDQLLELNYSHRNKNKIEDIYGIIYRIECIPEKKSYIGQTFSHTIEKNGIRKKGILVRIKEHVKDSKIEINKQRPLYKALNNYSYNDFIIHEEKLLYKNEIHNINTIEGEYIKKYNGFNIDNIGKVKSNTMIQLSKFYNFNIIDNNCHITDNNRENRRKDISFGERFHLPNQHNRDDDFLKEHLKQIKIESIKLMKSNENFRIVIREINYPNNIRINYNNEYDKCLKFVKELVDDDKIIIHNSIKNNYKYQEKLDKTLQIDGINNVTVKQYNMNSDRGITYHIFFYGLYDTKQQLLHKVTFTNKSMTKVQLYNIMIEFINKFKEHNKLKKITYNVAQ